MPSQVGGGGVSLFLQGTLHGANSQGQRVRGGSQEGYSGHHGTEVIGMKAINLKLFMRFKIKM